MESVGALVRRQLETGSVWQDRDSVHVHDALERAMASDAALRAGVAREIPALLASADLRHRTGAVALLRAARPDLEVDALAACIEANEHGLAGVQPAWSLDQPDLEHSAACALAPMVSPRSPAALAWLRRMALERPWRGYVVGTIATHDPEWLLAHARELVRHTDYGVLSVLSPDRQHRLIDALAPFPPEKETFFTRSFWKSMGAEASARLRARMWPPARRPETDAAVWLTDPARAIELELVEPSRCLVSTLREDGTLVARRFGGPVHDQGRLVTRPSAEVPRWVGVPEPALVRRVRHALAECGFPMPIELPLLHGELVSWWRVRAGDAVVAMDAPRRLQQRFPELAEAMVEISSRAHALSRSAPSDAIPNPELASWDGLTDARR